jgi:hypothetical protein
MNFIKNNSLIFRDLLLTKTVGLLKQSYGINVFSHNVIDYMFEEEDKCQNEVRVNNLIKNADFLDKKIAALLNYKNRK